MILGTDQQSYLYCAAYGNGNFIVRGFRASSISNEWTPWQCGSGGEQGGRRGRTGNPGDCDFSEG